MTCSACCATVEATLDALPGVINAVVSLIQQQARVDYAASVVSPVHKLLQTTFTCPGVAPCGHPLHGEVHLQHHTVPLDCRMSWFMRWRIWALRQKSSAAGMPAACASKSAA